MFLPIFAICLLLASGAARAQTPAAFAVQSMPVRGRVIAAEIADLDGDAHAELLTVVARGVGPDEVRSIETRRVGRDGHVAPEPTWSAPLPAGAAGYDLADLDGRPGVELLLLERDGVRVLSRSGGGTEWRRLLVPVPPTIGVQADERGLDRMRLARPELGAGRLLVPGLGAAWVLGARGEVVARLAIGGRANYLVPTRPGPEIGESEVELYFDVPALHVADIDGDGRGDVVASSRTALQIFQQRADGSFGAEPDHELPFRLIGPEDLMRGSGSVRAQLFDVDRDGRADLLVSLESGGLLRAENHARLHRNRGGTFDLAHPDLDLERTGGVAADEIVDLDGDGRPEWLRIFLPLGVIEIAELFLQRSVDLQVAVHRPSADGAFEREPALSRSLSIPIDFETLRPRGFLPSLREDWNRDGQRDLLGSAGGAGVEVWLGGPEHRFARADSRDPFDSSGRVSTGDLDGDSLPDFVVYDPRRDDAPIHVGINLGKLPGTAARIAPGR